MKQDSLAQNQWIDIVVPPPPESDALLWWLISLFIIFIIGCVAVYLWQIQPLQTARRKIKRLSKQIHTEQGNRKELLKQLERILCHRFGVTHLNQLNLEDTQWPVFQQQLNQACYQAQTPNNEQAQQLITKARLFINKPGMI